MVDRVWWDVAATGCKDDEGEDGDCKIDKMMAGGMAMKHGISFLP